MFLINGMIYMCIAVDSDVAYPMVISFSLVNCPLIFFVYPWFFTCFKKKLFSALAIEVNPNQSKSMMIILISLSND